MDSTHDQFAEQGSFWIVNLTDNPNREAPSMKIALPLPAEHTVRALDQVIEWYGKWRASLLLKNQPFPPTPPH